MRGGFAFQNTQLWIDQEILNDESGKRSRPSALIPLAQKRICLSGAPEASRDRDVYGDATLTQILLWSPVLADPTRSTNAFIASLKSGSAEPASKPLLESPGLSPRDRNA